MRSSLLAVDHQYVGPQLDQCRSDQSSLDRGWRPVQQVRIPKVAVLADHHTPIAIRDPAELCVRRPVPVRQLRRVHRVMTCITQQPRHARRELRVDEEPHAAPSGVIRLRAASAPNSNAANRSSRSRSG